MEENHCGGYHPGNSNRLKLSSENSFGLGVDDWPGYMGGIGLKLHSLSLVVMIVLLWCFSLNTQIEGDRVLQYFK